MGTNYVVAYDGPASMRTVYGWIPSIHSKLGIVIQDLSKEANQRIKIASPSIDGIFVLKKGFVYFDNVPFGFANDNVRAEHADLKWVFADTPDGNLLLFFLFLQTATANIEGKWLNALPYLQTFQVPNISFGRA